MLGAAAAEMSADTRIIRDPEVATGVSFGTSELRGRVKDFHAGVVPRLHAGFLGLGIPRARGLLIGHDLRPSSPGIAPSAICRLMKQAGKPITRGRCPSRPILLGSDVTIRGKPLRPSVRATRSCRSSSC